MKSIVDMPYIQAGVVRLHTVSKTCWQECIMVIAHLLGKGLGCWKSAEEPHWFHVITSGFFQNVREVRAGVEI